jgi:prephenate dehydrogenase
MTTPSDFADATISTLTIVGVGLIGGSLAAAAKSRGVAKRIIGVGRNAAKLDGAISRGLLDEATADLAAAARQSDLIVFCTPVDRVASGVREAAAVCRCNTLITDAGSTKLEICQDLETGLPPGVEFIGSHPLAGSEKNGYEHADANLFAKRVCVLTPHERTSRLGLQRLRSFWERLGARLVEMSPAAHDRAVAEISHFPHLAAAALAATLAPEHKELAARGFRDTTRIAAGDPDLWTSILMCNADYIAQSLEKYDAILQEYRTALRKRDATALRRLLEQGKTVRDGLST